MCVNFFSSENLNIKTFEKTSDTMPMPVPIKVPYAVRCALLSHRSCLILYPCDSPALNRVLVASRGLVLLRTPSGSCTRGTHVTWGPLELGLIRTGLEKVWKREVPPKACGTSSEQLTCLKCTWTSDFAVYIQLCAPRQNVFSDHTKPSHLFLGSEDYPQNPG